MTSRNKLESIFREKYYNGETLAAKSQILRKKDRNVATFSEILELIKRNKT